MLADDRDRLGRRNVIARAPDFLAGDAIEVFLDNLLPPRQSVAPTHGTIMADQVGARRDRHCIGSGGAV